MARHCCGPPTQRARQEQQQCLTAPLPCWLHLSAASLYLTYAANPFYLLFFINLFSIFLSGGLIAAGQGAARPQEESDLVWPGVVSVVFLFTVPYLFSPGLHFLPPPFCFRCLVLR